jgi:hypothetical protein
MQEIIAVLARQCFCQFALEQPVPLDVLREAAENLSLPMAATQAPEWFSAAASPEALLVDLAPELQIVSAETVDPEVVSAQVADIDLVSMYAPELSRGADPGEPVAPAPVSAEPVEAKGAGENSDSSAAIRLLRELSGLDD